MSKLLDNFKGRTKQDWLEKVTKDLKGKGLDSLNWELTPDLVFSPFAHPEDRPSPFPPITNNKNTNNWESGVVINGDDEKNANKVALDLLNAGANALCFKLSKAPSRVDLKILLDKVQLEWISTHFMLEQDSWINLSTHFYEIIKENGQNPDNVVCSFGREIDSVMETKGISSLKSIINQLPKAQFLSVNSIKHFSNKENIPAAIAHTVYQGNQYLVAMNEEGFPLKEILPAIQFNISLTDSYLLNIASIRALRILWNQVVSAWAADLSGNVTIAVHLDETTQISDENYNKIKAGAQAMSAVVGNVDRLFIYPSDEFKIQGGTSFSQRIALNIQHLLKLESYMDRVVDPAAGSYYIEEMTDKLAAAAWKIFTQEK